MYICVTFDVESQFEVEHAQLLYPNAKTENNVIDESCRLKESVNTQQFLDVLTSMQTYRPKNLNTQVTFGTESEVEVVDVQFLSLELNMYETRSLLH